MKRVLDLFAGTGSATAAFADSPDWEVTTVEIEERFEPDVCADILDVRPEDLPHEDYDVVWASPPCTKFSVAAIGHSWTRDHLPRSRDAVEAVRVVYHTLWLIQELMPEFWFMENPRGKLRTLLPMNPAGTVMYCQYGADYMKPTDLWGVYPASFEYKSCYNGAGCHVSSPRGSQKGVQSSELNAEERSMIPRGLSEAVLDAVENPERGMMKQKAVDGWLQ